MAMPKIPRAARTDRHRLDMLSAIQRHIVMQEQISGAVSEAGRALGILRAAAKANPRDFSDLLARMSRTQGRQLDDLMDDLGRFGDTNARQVVAAIKKPFGGKVADVIFEWWVNSILSGPITQATNIISHLGVAVGAIPESAAAAGFDIIKGHWPGFRSPNRLNEEGRSLCRLPDQGRVRLRPPYSLRSR